MSDEEQLCEDNFRQTTIVREKRFSVKLPFKDVQLGDSLCQAERRFHSLERRLQGNPELRQRYKAFIDEFLQMDHMEAVPTEEITKPSNETFYIPHHCVFKEESTSTKLRVVFDGSAKTSNGHSLNDALMVGATIQDDLLSIITCFRLHPSVLSADIAKMYRQAGLEEPDRDFHRILWRNDPSEPMQHSRIKRVTYGISSSSFHAIRCLFEVANRTTNPTNSRTLPKALLLRR